VTLPVFKASRSEPAALLSAVYETTTDCKLLKSSVGGADNAINMQPEISPNRGENDRRVHAVFAHKGDAIPNYEHFVQRGLASSRGFEGLCGFALLEQKRRNGSMSYVWQELPNDGEASGRRCREILRAQTHPNGANDKEADAEI
jgi:hypothetical protein